MKETIRDLKKGDWFEIGYVAVEFIRVEWVQGDDVMVEVKRLADGWRMHHMLRFDDDACLMSRVVDRAKRKEESND